MAISLLGILSAAAGGVAAGGYWISLLFSGAENPGNSGAVDSSGNFYLGGRTVVSGENRWQLAKQNPDGSIDWQKEYPGANGFQQCLSVIADSNDDVVFVGQIIGGGGGRSGFLKVDSSGAPLIRHFLGTAFNEFQGISKDSSDNYYAAGRTNLIKYNSSGSIQWQRTLSGVSGINISSVATSASGDSYLVVNVGAANENYLIKYNSSGTLQWQRKITGGSNLIFSDVALDSSENVYIAGYADLSGNFEGLFFKYNSSGTLQWQRKIGGVGFDTLNGVVADSNNDVYICGRATVGDAQGFIAKYDSSGSLLFQRTLATTAFDLINKIKVNSNNDLMIVGVSNIDGNSDILSAKLPNDGSLTGTYAVGSFSFTYSASSLTDTAASQTDAAGSLSSAAGSLSLTSTTQALTNTTLTESLANL